MFIATATKKVATVTWYIINIIKYWHFVKKKRCNEDKNIFFIITHINKTTTINYLHIEKKSSLL